MNQRPDIIFVVGPTGSGKTTVGRRIAGSLGYRFIDCDEEIERRTGASINLIFDIEGEPGFRQRESQVLDEVSTQPGTLVATGGGVVLRAANRRLMAQRGFVIWLQTTVEQQLKRLELDRQRPLLQTPDRRARLEEQARERDPLYAEIADLAFRSGNHSAQYMARELARQLQAQWAGEEQEPSRATN